MTRDIVRRCIMDFVRRGGVYEGNVSEVAARVVESLKLFGMIKQEDENG